MIQKNLSQGWNRDTDGEDGHADLCKGGGRCGRGALMYTHCCEENRELVGSCWTAQGAQRGAL